MSKVVVPFSPLSTLKAIDKGELDPDKLTRQERDICIEYLRFDEGYSYYEIAHLMKCDRKTASAVIKRTKQRNSVIVEQAGYDVYGEAFEVMRMTALVKRKARDAGDWRLYMDAHYKMLDKLQSLGVIYEAPKKVEHSGNIGIELTAKQREELIAAYELVEEADTTRKTVESLPPDKPH